MVTLYGILTLLLVFVAPSHSISCTQCVSTTSTSCTGQSMTCPSDHQCGVTYTTSGIDGTTTSTIYVMSCLSRAMCNFTGSGSFMYGVKTKTATSCCNTDNCTPSLPSLPPDNSNPNGLTCRTCISKDSTWCYTDETTQCTGNENMCLLQTTKVKGPVSASFALRGCSTKSLCDIGSQTQSNEGTTAEVKFICTSGSTGLQKGFYLPGLLCLFLLKLSL